MVTELERGQCQLAKVGYRRATKRGLSGSATAYMQLCLYLLCSYAEKYYVLHAISVDGISSLGRSKYLPLCLLSPL